MKHRKQHTPTKLLMYVMSDTAHMVYNFKEIFLDIYTIMIFFPFSDSGLDLAINNPVIKSRELFISDATDTYPVAALR